VPLTRSILDGSWDSMSPPWPSSVFVFKTWAMLRSRPVCRSVTRGLAPKLPFLHIDPGQTEHMCPKPHGSFGSQRNPDHKPVRKQGTPAAASVKPLWRPLLNARLWCCARPCSRRTLRCAAQGPYLAPNSEAELESLTRVKVREVPRGDHPILAHGEQERLPTPLACASARQPPCQPSEPCGDH